MSFSRWGASKRLEDGLVRSIKSLFLISQSHYQQYSMTNIKALSSEEKMITLVACLIGIVFFLFYSKACQPVIDFASSRVTNEAEYDSSEVAVFNSGEIEDAFPEAPHTYSALRAELDAIEEEYASMEASTSFATWDEGDAELVATRFEAEEPESSYASIEETKVVVVENEMDPAAFAELEFENEVLLEQLRVAKAENELLSVANSEKERFLSALKEARISEEEAHISEATKLKGKVEALTAQVDDLNATLTSPPISKSPESAAEPKEEEAPAFVESEADLDEPRAALVVAIRKMEDLRGDGLKKQYEELGTSLNADSLARIKFKSGKSDLLTNESEKITNLSSSMDEKSEMLVVGFADPSGSKEANAALSSARAQAVANFLGSKIGNSRVSAIYLGQTARFGAKSENRVVEIWEVKSAQ